MIQMRAWVDVADNTGAKVVMCIHVIGVGNRRTAGIGDVIVASVKKSLPGGELKSGDVVKGVVVRTKQSLRREDGSYVRFDHNAIVLIDADVRHVPVRKAPRFAALRPYHRESFAKSSAFSRRYMSA